VYPPAATFRRADTAGYDRDRCWRRGDQEFFADGACHILAFAAASVFPRLSVVALRKDGDMRASHAIASDGLWAFDHAGWTREAEILAETARLEPGTSWEMVAVDRDLGSYCVEQGARDRHEFAHDPWWRAIAYLAKSPPPPVVSATWRDAVPLDLPEQTTGPALVW
jgi:hypothetical protein